MHIDVLSLFPEYMTSPLNQSILKRAIEKNILTISQDDIRSYSTDPHHRVDDRSFGGGPGMVLMVDPIMRAVASKKRANTKVLYLSPQGRRLTPAFAKELSQESHLILLAGHYEGIDERVIDAVVDYEVSIGDYVVTNGCLSALVLIDVLARYIPDVLGDARASESDSFESALLDFPHYTRPEVYNGQTVPKELLTGNHEKISSWRKAQALCNTALKRPDLFSPATLTQTVSGHDIQKPTLASSLISVEEIAIPAALFSESCRFFTKLFGAEPTYSSTQGVEKASWPLVQGSIGLTLYNAFSESASLYVPITLKITVDFERLYTFVRWVMNKKSLQIENEPFSQYTRGSVQEYLDRKGGVTLLEPSGHRVFISSCLI